MESIFFYICATILVLASLAVVFARNPLYNVLCLVTSIFALSSLFVLLEAFFVGIILLLVYAGAVLVFFLFVVMCLNLNDPTFTEIKQNRFRILGSLAGASFLLAIYLTCRSYFSAVALTPVCEIRGTIENVGKILFTDYLLPFELTSLLLLIALFGIVSLAQGALKSK